MNNAKIRISSLLLGAGLGSRMKSSFKLLKPFLHHSVICQVAKNISEADFSEVILVTGFKSEEVQKALSQFHFPHVFNSRYETGMHSSIRMGLEKVSDQSLFFAVCLGDQPLIHKEEFNQLIDATRNHPEAKLIYPEFQGQRGHPVLISMSLKNEILAHPDDDKGCSYLFKKYESLGVPMKTDACLMDLDTDEDYNRLLKRIMT